MTIFTDKYLNTLPLESNVALFCSYYVPSKAAFYQSLFMFYKYRLGPFANPLSMVNI